MISQVGNILFRFPALRNIVDDRKDDRLVPEGNHRRMNFHIPLIPAGQPVLMQYDRFIVAQSLGQGRVNFRFGNTVQL
ncbi:hypothetical protein D3C71_1912190 [compost metagenome]